MTSERPPLTAIATALYDTFHTARLFEHPEDLEQYEGHAGVFVRWLGVQGFSVTKKRKPKEISDGW